MPNECAFSFLATLRLEFKHTHLVAFQYNRGFFTVVHWSIWGLSVLNEGTLVLVMFWWVLYFLLSSSDQPNHAEEENCAVIRTESSGRWQNRDCSVALPYFCKKRPNATLDPFTTGQYIGMCISPLKWNTAVMALPKFYHFAPTDSWADDEKYECDVGWQSFQAGCYKLTSEKTDWETAQKICQKMEANLVSIHTLPELEFILRNVKKGDLYIF